MSSNIDDYVAGRKPDMRELVIKKLARTWTEGVYGEDDIEAAYERGVAHYSSRTDWALLGEIISDAYKEGLHSFYE